MVQLTDSSTFCISLEDLDWDITLETSDLFDESAAKVEDGLEAVPRLARRRTAKPRSLLVVVVLAAVLLVTGIRALMSGGDGPAEATSRGRRTAAQVTTNGPAPRLLSSRRGRTAIDRDPVAHRAGDAHVDRKAAARRPGGVGGDRRRSATGHVVPASPTRPVPPLAAAPPPATGTPANAPALAPAPAPALAPVAKPALRSSAPTASSEFGFER